MDEIEIILDKYHEDYVRTGLTSATDLNAFAAGFYKDVAELLECITRVVNVERNPSGYSLDDAPILGLLVRGWKLLKEVIRYYEEGNAEVVGILERPLLEAAVVAQYLMQGDSARVEDYRKCSYKDRVRMLRDQAAASRSRTPCAHRGQDRSLQQMTWAGLRERATATPSPVALATPTRLVRS